MLSTLGSLLRDIGTNLVLNVFFTLLIGFGFGSVRLQPDGVLTIAPTTIATIPITGLIFGLIMGVLTTLLTVKAIRAAIGITEPSDSAAPENRWLTWLPKKTGWLTAVVSAIVMAFSFVALPLLMRLFGWSQLNFGQFIAFITVYATIIGRLTAYALRQRLMQRDYLDYARS